MANKYNHSKVPNAFKQKRTNARYKIANIKVGGKRQLGNNFGLYAHPLGKTYAKATGVIGKTNRAASVA
jgi:hypothetical protein